MPQLIQVQLGKPGLIAISIKNQLQQICLNQFQLLIKIKFLTNLKKTKFWFKKLKNNNQFN